ncbi:tripartite tricarboxylate transporter substrate binding protein [Bordetella sp. BOR01]|uniref:Bug family tripartite tricarboxylate transporter substrate binding protein n=1 Tax=Bordetella sp. BOR01 TaxID=2854779 RepID=UPI001C44D816|nr:tripartite tricarboxylate transporter substrate binding protein [Bordetella sp. BOR01]
MAFFGPLNESVQYARKEHAPALMGRRSFLAAMAALGVCGPSRAAGYPARPLTLYVPFAAGGIADSNARLVAEKLAGRLGQPFVVDNRPGAGGNIALGVATRAAPDGYSLMFGTNGTHAANRYLYKDFPYDPVRDFVPVHGLFADFNVLVTGTKAPFATFDEFLALARKQPGRLTYASAGVGTAQHLVAELLQQVAGIRLLHVPYKGAGLAMNDLMAGTVDVMFDYPITSLPLIGAGKLRALVTTGPQPLPSLPGVPTIAAAGYGGAQSSVWSGLFAPRGTPADAVAVLSDACRRVLEDPALQARAAQNGTELLRRLDAQAFPAFVAAEAGRWKDIVQTAHVQL